MAPPSAAAPFLLLRRRQQQVLVAAMAQRRFAARLPTTATSSRPQRPAMMNTCTKTFSSYASPTPHLYARPDQYVSGVSADQLETNEAVRDWYLANFPSWKEEPEKFIATAEMDTSSVNSNNANDDDSNKEITTNPHAITLPHELTSRNIRPLVAYLRKSDGTESGSRNCNRLRNNNYSDENDNSYFPLVPGILHGSDPTSGILSIHPTSKILVKTPWFEIQRELDRYSSGRNGSFENRVYALTVYSNEDAHVGYHKSIRQWNKDDTKYELDEETMTVTKIPAKTPVKLPERTPILQNVLVIPSDLQLHPVLHSALCLNYIRYHPNKPIQIPIRAINEEESPAMKRGGFIAFVNTFVECLVEEGAPIPERIELECTGLRQKDVVRRDRLIIPRGVTIHPRVKSDFLVGTVFGAKGSSGDDAEEGGEQSKK